MSKKGFKFMISYELAARRDIKTGPKMLHARLDDYAGIDSNGFAWPGMARLADELGTSRRQIVRWLAVLADKGLVKIEHRGKGETNRYFLFGGRSDKSVNGGDKMSPRVVTKCHPTNNSEQQQTNNKRKGCLFGDEFVESILGDTPTNAIMAAWGEWVQHRKSSNHPMTELAAKKTLKKMKGMGHDRAIAAIDNSIASGYRGLFEPTGAPKSSPARPRRDTSRFR